MFPKLKISSLLLKRFEKVNQECSGCLYGVMYDCNLLLLGFNIETTIGQLNYKNIQHKLPAEIDLCGLIKFGTCTDAEAHLSEIIKDVDITDNPILLHCDLGTLVDLKASVFMHGKLENIPFEVIDENVLYSQFCVSRIRYNVSLLTDGDAACIQMDVQKLRKNLAGGNLAFHVENTDAYFIGNASGTHTTLPAYKTISDLVQLKRNAVGESGKLKNQKRADPNHYEVINIKVLKGRTTDTVQPPAVSMIFKKNESKIHVPLYIDAMAILHRNTKIGGLYDILIESICRGLRLMEGAMVDWVVNGNPLNSIPRTYHFAIPNFGHFVTCVYFDNVSDDHPYMQQKRKKLHLHFGLPTYKPYLRRANKFLFKDELPNGALVNVHIGIKPSGLNGKQYLVQGTYSYYHYMQQGIDDNGWGCAYRSLQTLCSWFRWQGYTERDIPKHDEIQKYLVQIEDKPSSFAGSRQWIGSTEVSMCLNGFLNVDSKILHVKSGAELGSKGPELAMHFESQGTPIMIGGGVLAHTIIGVDYDHSNNKVKFLILDPHYTGEDDLSIIQSKGWCGWKGPEFWDKKAYYNLCLPQRPFTY